MSECGSETFDAGSASVDSTPGANRTEALREQMFGSAVAALEIYTVYLGERLGLYRALADGGSAPSAQLAGPPIGAALFVAGTAWPFVTEAVLVVAGVLLVSRIVLPAHGRGRGSPSGVWHGIGEGLRWTMRHPAVRTLILTILIFNITFGAAWSVLVLYATQRLGLGAVGFGLLTTISAAGGLVGTAMYGWPTRRVSLGNVMRVGIQGLGEQRQEVGAA